MEELKKITYHLGHDDPAPVVGQYLVTLGKRGVLHVELIKTVRKVNSRTVSDVVKYALELLPQPHLKEYTVVQARWRSANVWVRGVEALPCYWMARGKPKKRFP